MQVHTFAPTPTTSLPLRRPHRRPPTTSSSSTITTFSTSDADLDSRGFALHHTIAGLDLDALNNVFARVGFPRRDPRKIMKALEHTPSLVWVAHREMPVAFARATGDGVFNAVVWDVVVDPSYQGIGLGRVVMERLIEELVGRGITNISLYADPKVIGFYRPLGFAVDPDGVKGMAYSRKQMRPQQKRRW
ncbi:putative acetyltransferase NSI [Acorus gramineus]|uniref:Acetyltransferase NSI n=1 Tax=Acorus gramineus TaxID=55184 RepID=A0AAV9B9J7_ACOGR|nr:putative acetyltransferase NSI [Acorus gramineus]